VVTPGSDQRADRVDPLLKKLGAGKAALGCGAKTKLKGRLVVERTAGSPPSSHAQAAINRAPMNCVVS